MTATFRAAFIAGDFVAAARALVEPSPVEVLEDAYPGFPVVEADGYAVVAAVDQQISIQPDPAGGYRATRCRLAFEATATGRTPAEALAGLGAAP